jgi:hypothetical protein
VVNLKTIVESTQYFIFEYTVIHFLLLFYFILLYFTFEQRNNTKIETNKIKKLRLFLFLMIPLKLMTIGCLIERIRKEKKNQSKCIKNS